MFLSLDTEQLTRHQHKEGTSLEGMQQTHQDMEIKSSKISKDKALPSDSRKHPTVWFRDMDCDNKSSKDVGWVLYKATKISP